MYTRDSYTQVSEINHETKDVFDGITQLFDRFVLVDLEANTYKYINSTYSQSNIIPVEGEYAVLVNFICSMLIKPEDQMKLRLYLKPDIIQKNMPIDVPYLRYEYYINRVTPHWEDLNLICLERKENLVTKLLVTKQDISSTKEKELRNRQSLEEALRIAAAANHAKAEFLSRMSHRLRTPLNVITGMTKIATLHIDKPERVNDCLNKINAASQELLLLINQVLDMSDSKPNPPKIDAPSEIALLQNKDFSGKRILLVDDNEINIEIAEELITAMNASVEKAYDGREALSILEATPPGYYDLVLMDIQMPFMNGYEATKAIRASVRNDLKTLPIVSMTADAFPEDVVHALCVGMNGHIAKPITTEAIANAITKWAC